MGLSRKESGLPFHSLQGIFPTQGWKPGLLCCRPILYHLSYWEAFYGDFGKGPRISSFYLRSYLCKCFLFIINPRWVTLIISCITISVLVAQSSPTLCDPMDCSLPGTSVCGIFPGKNTGMGSHSLLQGIFLTQGSNPGLPHCRQICYHLSHQGSWKEEDLNRET